MKIRPYQEKDFEEAKRLCADFVDMIEDLLPEDLRRFEAMAPGGIDFWVSEAANQDKAFFVAEETPGRLVGFIQGHIIEDKSIKLDRWGVLDAIFVSELFRGRGIGRDLYEALEKWFAGQGCVAARVETWIINTPAIKAYETMGFRPFFTGLVKEIPSS